MGDMREAEKWQYNLSGEKPRWHEIRTWAITCHICGRTMVVEGIEMPDDLPDNWERYSDGVWCDRCMGRESDT